MGINSKKSKSNRIGIFLLDLISFNTPSAIVINLSVILIFLFIIPTEFLKYLPIRSVLKDFLLPIIFNGSCPIIGVFKDCNVYSTGETRGLSRLLHGDLVGAYYYNPLVFLVFVVIIILIIVNVLKIIKSKK
jgi:hypothetical protein